MGMFDYINFKHDCPVCGHVLDDWQSKDGPCELLNLDPLWVYNFYTSCENCNLWAEATRFETYKFKIKYRFADFPDDARTPKPEFVIVNEFN